MSKSNRREFLAKASLLSLAAFTGAALGQSCNGASPENESASPSPAPAPAPAEEAIADGCGDLNANLNSSDKEVRKSVGYQGQSPVADQDCKNCRFYQPEKFDGPCGGCQLFVNGAVSPSAWCKSWAATDV